MNKKLLLLFIVLCIICSGQIKAQSLEETLSSLASTVGAAYVKPVISAFGSNLNSGWVSQVPSATKLGFHFDLKVIAMGSFFPSDVKNFSQTGQYYFNDQQAASILQSSGIQQSNPNYNQIKTQITNTPFNVNFSGPTIVGSKNQYLAINFPAQNFQGNNLAATTFTLNQVKGFLDELPALPTAAVQLTVGTVFGTNVAVRYFPDVEIQNMGKFSFFGAGFIHNFGVWFPNPLPVDLGVGFFTQKMKVGDIFESNATQYGLYVSKTFGFIISITPYAGLTTESSKTTISYNYQSNQNISGVPVPPVKISFDLEGENSTSAVVGINLHLAVVNINADYKFAKTKTASAGISFGL